MTTFIFTQALNTINSRKNSVINKFNSSPFGQLLNYTKNETIWKKDKISGKLSEISLQTSTYNKIIPIVYGVNKLAGNIIWLGEVQEVSNDNTTTIKIGKGQKIKQTSIDYFYFLSFAVAICKGEIYKLNNVWADTTLLDLSKYQYRFYRGTSDQEPDSLIEAVNGVGKTPSYRDICYIVFENFPLSEFNNRIPNFLFEVTRKNDINADDETSLENCVKGINFAPCTGEYTYDCAIQYKAGEQFDPDELENVEGIWYQLNNNNNSKIADGLLSLNQFFEEFKNCEFVAPQIAFFGNSLDISNCSVEPRIEFNYFPTNYPIFTRPDSYTVGNKWNRYNTPMLGKNSDGTFRFNGGTTSDSSILGFFKELKTRGKKTIFHPKLLIDIETAPSSKLLSGNSSSIKSFFTKNNGYNEYIKHYANLLKGYVDVFIIGSELCGITSIKDENNNFPAVDELIGLAEAIRGILGNNVLISYAADYREYHDINNWYALDKLWANENIDFIGINAYFPLTNLPQDSITKDIIKSGWKSGEGYDYVYLNGKQELIESKYAYKNIEYWWVNRHINLNGTISPWIPKSKKIWFTEYGFCSIDACTNEPYKKAGDFPKYSLGSSDFFAQRMAIEATEELFKNSEFIENKILYYWDVRPYPFYPNRTDIWLDGTKWKYDYALNGKVGISNANVLIYQLLKDAEINTDIIENVEIDEFVDGFVINNSISVIDALYILQKVYFFDCVEKNGKISFISNKKSFRKNQPIVELDKNSLVNFGTNNENNYIKIDSLGNNELPKKLNLIFLDKNNDYDTSSVYAERDCVESNKIEIDTLPIVLDSEKARNIAEISLYLLWLERLEFNFCLPIRYLYLTASDLVKINIDDNNSVILKIKTIDIENLVVKVNAVLFDSTIYDYIDKKPLNPNLELLSEAGKTYLNIFEIPALNDNMLDKIYVLFSLGGEFINWSGCSLYYSDNGSKSYTKIGETNKNYLFGKVINVPKNAKPYYFDNRNELTISFHGNVDDNKLINISDQEIFNGGNTALYGKEIIRFKNVELLENGLYKISNLIRGLFDTENEINKHKKNDKFLLLNDMIITQEFASDKIKSNYLYKAVTFDTNISNTNNIFYELLGTNLKPFRVCHVSTNLENNSLFVKWEEKGRGYRNWIDNIDYISPEKNGEFCIQLLSNNNILKTLYTKDRSISFNINEFGLNNEVNLEHITVKICHRNELYGNGEWVEVPI